MEINKKGGTSDVKLFIIICFVMLYFARRWREENMSRFATLPNSLRVFQGERVSSSNYASRFSDGILSNQINITKLTLAEKIAINRRMFNASLELYQNVKPKFKSTALRRMFGTPAQEALGGYGIFEYVFKGKGNLSMLLIGNSHATHIVQDVRAVFYDQYKELTMFAIAKKFEADSTITHRFIFTPDFLYECACPSTLRKTSVEAILFLERPCSEYNEAVLRLIQLKKPDILFINFYWGLLNPPAIHNSTAAQNDQMVADFQFGLDRLSRYTKLVYFGMPHLQFNFFVADELAKRLWQGLSLDILNVAHKDHLLRTKANRDRINLLKCAKCVFVDWSQVFCKNGICHSFDPTSQLAYFIDKHHYSFLGCLRIRSLLQKLKANLQADLIKTRNIM